jgi:hypothetical protein
MAVREYLVNAYKFLGVDYYGKNKLMAALEQWQKATKLNPENAEIERYINRVENELKNIKELSYE